MDMDHDFEGTILVTGVTGGIGTGVSSSSFPYARSSQSYLISSPNSPPAFNNLRYPSRALPLSIPIPTNPHSLLKLKIQTP